jgi:threonine aldolase
MMIDLRSDTVTRPTPEMYEAMRKAPLGDDVLGDDPTVIELESLAAEKVGMESAMFVPSGTMGNQIALAVHCARGDAILIEEEAHILYYEVGAPAIIAGVVSWTLPSTRGVIDPATVESHILKRNIHTPGTTLLCLENSHNRAGGTVIPLQAHAAYRDIADRHAMRIHLDGARVFNAAVAIGVDVREITKHVDTVNFCLSKGLRSPIGSLLCGSTSFIDEARIWRKRLGGGMRQAGILAACGIVSLNTMVERLAEDHAHARTIAQGLQGMPNISANVQDVETNMVLVDTVAPAAEVMERLAARGVGCLPVGPHRLRLVLHGDIVSEMIPRVVDDFASAAA